MKKNYTHIEVIVDKSGSMASTVNDTLGSLNTFVNKQKEVPGTCSYQLVQFNSRVDAGTFFENINDVPTLTTAGYFPRGNTALFDAIGDTINKLGARLASAAEENRPEKVIVVILTDGEENASVEYKHDQINKMINHQRDVYKWEFVFLGANQDAIKVGTSLGVAAGASLSYAGGMTANSMNIASRGISNSRRYGAVIGTAVNSYTEADRVKAMEPTPVVVTPNPVVDRSSDPFNFGKDTNSQGEKV